MPESARPLFRLMPTCQLVLASSSPRRQEFLRALGLQIEIMGNLPEAEHGENARERAICAARSKALAASRLLVTDPPAWLDATKRLAIIGADTVVEIGRDILGKPASHAAALEMLRLLNGQTCSVFSACCLLIAAKTIVHCDETKVSFHQWPDTVLSCYARDAEPMDKAGAFAIQGRGSFLIDQITGSYTTVLGIPGSQLVQSLLGEGIIEAETKI